MGDKTPGLGKPGSTNGMQDHEHLLLALRDFDASKRQQAAQALGKLKSKGAVPALIGRLQNDLSPQVKIAAARALYQIGDPQAWPAIADTLNKYPGNEEVWVECALLLGQINDRKYSQALVSALSNRSEKVRYQAAQSLGIMKDPAVIASLIAGFDKSYSWSESEWQSSAYAKALTSIGIITAESILLSARNGINKRVPILKEFGAEVISVISNHLSATDVDVRRLGTLTLAEISQDESTKLLCMIAQKEATKDIREIAMKALAKRPSNQVAGTLIWALQNDQEAELRNDAASALGDLQARQAVEALCLVALNDKAWGVSQAAITALGKIKDTRSIPALGSILLDHDSSSHREMAAVAIGNIAAPEGISYLMSSLGSDSEYKVRKAAALGLKFTRDSGVIRALSIVATSDPDTEVRQAAQETLGVLGYSAPPPPAPNKPREKKSYDIY